jgi:hypothetical protein
MELIEIVSQVLAFEETPSHKDRTRDSRDTGANSTQINLTTKTLTTDRSAKHTSNTDFQINRAQASSDPFLDDLAAASSSQRDTIVVSDKLTTMEDLTSKIEELVSPFHDEQLEEDEEYMRTWTSPADLTNPELLQLLKLFPSFVSRRQLPRFPISDARLSDIEEGEDMAEEGRRIHFGTGSMWISSKDRVNGWGGGWWTRFLLWWRRLFC